MPGISGNSTPQAISGIDEVTPPSGTLPPTRAVASTSASDGAAIAGAIGTAISSVVTTGNISALNPVIDDLEKVLVGALSNAAMAVPVVGPVLAEGVATEAPKAINLLANAVGDLAKHIGVKLEPEFQSWLKDLNAVL